MVFRMSDPAEDNEEIGQRWKEYKKDNWTRTSVNAGNGSKSSIIRNNKSVMKNF